MGATDVQIVLLQFIVEAGWVLVPLFPAVLCYIVFPKDTFAMSGPFQNLTVSATGAFAAYFVLLLASLPLISEINRNFRTLLRPSWIVSGKVIVQDENAHAIPLITSDGSMEVSLKPDILTLDGSNGFQILVPEIDHRIPKITVRYRGYGVSSIDLQEPGVGQMVRRDDASRQIEITSPIIIRKSSCVGLSSGITQC